jgi:hypothetical protein
LREREERGRETRERDEREREGERRERERKRERKKRESKHVVPGRVRCPVKSYILLNIAATYYIHIIYIVCYKVNKMALRDVIH